MQSNHEELMKACPRENPPFPSNIEVRWWSGTGRAWPRASVRLGAKRTCFRAVGAPQAPQGRAHVLHCPAKSVGQAMGLLAPSLSLRRRDYAPTPQSKAGQEIALRTVVRDCGLQERSAVCSDCAVL